MPAKIAKKCENYKYVYYLELHHMSSLIYMYLYILNQAKYDAMNREMHVKNYKMVELEAELLSAKRAAQIAVDMAR